MCFKVKDDSMAVYEIHSTLRSKEAVIMIIV